MSADNTILVIETKRTALEESKGRFTNGKPNTVFRVAHVQAADNLEWYKKNQPYNLGAWLYERFKDSDVIPGTDKELAETRAQELLKEYEYVEYGIVFIDLTDMTFYGDW